MKYFMMTWFTVLCCLASLQVTNADKAKPAQPHGVATKIVVQDAIGDAATYFNAVGNGIASVAPRPRNTAANFFQLSEAIYQDGLPTSQQLKPPVGTLPVRGQVRQASFTEAPVVTVVTEAPSTVPSATEAATVQTITAAPLVQVKQSKKTTVNKVTPTVAPAVIAKFQEKEQMSLSPSSHQSQITYIFIANDKADTSKYLKHPPLSYKGTKAPPYKPTAAPAYEEYQPPQPKKSYGLPKAEPYKREFVLNKPSYEPEYKPAYHQEKKYQPHEEDTAWEITQSFNKYLTSPKYDPKSKFYDPGYPAYEKTTYKPTYPKQESQAKYDPEYYSRPEAYDQEFYPKNSYDGQRYSSEPHEPKYYPSKSQDPEYYPVKSYEPEYYPAKSYDPEYNPAKSYEPEYYPSHNQHQPKYYPRSQSPGGELYSQQETPKSGKDAKKAFGSSLKTSYYDDYPTTGYRSGKSLSQGMSFPPVSSTLDNFSYDIVWGKNYRQKRDTDSVSIKKSIATRNAPSNIKFQSLPKLMEDSTKVKTHERRNNPSGNRPAHYDDEKKENYEGPYIMSQLFGPPYEIGYIRSPVPDKHVYQDYLQFMKSSMAKNEKRDGYPDEKTGYKNDAYAAASQKSHKGTYGESYADARHVSDYEAPRYEADEAYKGQGYGAPATEYKAEKPKEHVKDSYTQAVGNKDNYSKEYSSENGDPKRTYGVPVYEGKNEYPATPYKEQETYKKDTYKQDDYKAPSQSYEKGAADDYGTARTNYELKYPEPAKYQEAKYEKKEEYKQSYEEPKRKYEEKSNYKQESYDPKPYEKPYESPKAYEKPYEAPRAYEKPYEAPKTYEKPYEKPKVYEKPYEAPETYEKPYEAPKTYEKPYEAPKAYEKPYEAPKNYEKPYEAPKSYEKTYETPKSYEKPYEAPRAYEKPYEAPKAYEKPYEDPKTYEKPYEAPKSYEKPYEAPRAPYEAPKYEKPAPTYEKTYESKKAYEEPTTYNKPYEATKAYEKPYEKPTAYEKPYEAPKAYEKPYEKPTQYDKPYEAPKAYEKPYESAKAYEKPYEAPKAYEKAYEAPYEKPYEPAKDYVKPYETPKAYEKPYEKEYESPKSYDKAYTDEYKKPSEAPKKYESAYEEKPYEASKSYEKPYLAPKSYEKPYETTKSYEKPYEAPQSYEAPTTYEKPYEAAKSYENSYVAPKTYGDDYSKGYETPTAYESYDAPKYEDQSYDAPKYEDKAYDTPKKDYEETSYSDDKGSEGKKKYPVIIGRYQVTSSDAFLPTKVGTKEEYTGSTYKKEEEYVVYYLPYGQPLPVPIQKRSLQVEDDGDLEVEESRHRGGSVFRGPTFERSTDRSSYGVFPVFSDGSLVNNADVLDSVTDEDVPLLENFISEKLIIEPVALGSGEALAEAIAADLVKTDGAFQPEIIGLLPEDVVEDQDTLTANDDETMGASEDRSADEDKPAMQQESSSNAVDDNIERTTIDDSIPGAKLKERQLNSGVIESVAAEEEFFTSRVEVSPVETTTSRYFYGIARTLADPEETNDDTINTDVVSAKAKFMTSPPLTSKLEKQWNGYSTWWTKVGHSGDVKLIRKRMPKVIE